MEPIRVLYLDHVAHLSGAEQSLFDVVVGLAGGPVEPVVILPEEGPLAHQLRAAGVLVRRVPMSKRLLETSRARLNKDPFVAVVRLFSFMAVVMRLRRIIKEIRPQVIHTNTLKTHLLAIIPARLAKIPLVWHVRDILPKGWLRRAFTMCARFPTRIVVPSRAVAASLGTNKTVYKKLRLIPNGIRVDVFGDRAEGRALREEIGARKSDPVVGIVGRLAPWKGQDVFVQAAAMLADRHPNVRFAIVGAAMFGDDAFGNELTSMVYDYRLEEQCLFTGWRSATEAMAALDIVVHASIEPEPFGRTIVEAMASGLPVVAAAGGAVQEILSPQAGFIVPPGRPEILADALEGLLVDAELRSEMGAAGHQIAGRYFDVRRTVSAVAALYSEISRDAAKSAARRQRRAPVRRNIRRPLAPSRSGSFYGGSPPIYRPAFDEPAPRRGRAAARSGNIRPQRRRAADIGVTPVRRTARIDEQLGDSFFDGPSAPAFDQRFGGGMPRRGSRRPAVLDFDEGPVRPVRRRPSSVPQPQQQQPQPRRRAVPALQEQAYTRPRRAKQPPVFREDPPMIMSGATATQLSPELDYAPPLRAPRRAPEPAPAARQAAPAQAAPARVAPQPTLSPMPVAIPRRAFYEFSKRLIDVVVGSLVLLIGLPVWLLVAFAIKFDSKGPVLFTGTVWGKDCIPFKYYKFRSMRTNGSDDGHKKFIENYVKLGAANPEGVFKFTGDPRITRMGRLIRKLSIDEIPQLWNVVRGQMSLVGPRPPLHYEYVLYDDWAKQRLAVRPGLTGLQQTYARHSASFSEKVEMDLAYIRDRSLRIDLEILLKTIPAALKGE